MRNTKFLGLLSWNDGMARLEARKLGDDDRKHDWVYLVWGTYGGDGVIVHVKRATLWNVIRARITNGKFWESKEKIRK